MNITELPMDVEDPGPLGRYRLAWRASRTAWQVMQGAIAAYRLAVLAEREARHAAVIAVPCPACEAPAGERCRSRPGFSFHRNVTCGMRDEPSGVRSASRELLDADR